MLLELPAEIIVEISRYLVLDSMAYHTLRSLCRRTRQLVPPYASVIRPGPDTFRFYIIRLLNRLRARLGPAGREIIYLDKNRRWLESKGGRGSSASYVWFSSRARTSAASDTIGTIYPAEYAQKHICVVYKITGVVMLNSPRSRLCLVYDDDCDTRVLSRAHASCERLSNLIGIESAFDDSELSLVQKREFEKRMRELEKRIWFEPEMMERYPSLFHNKPGRAVV